MVAELFKLNLTFRGLSDEDADEPGVDVGEDDLDEGSGKAPSDDDEDVEDPAMMA